MFSKMVEQRLISSMFSSISSFSNSRHMTCIILEILCTNLLQFLIFIESKVK
jgi:hypothetical protein